MRGTAQLSLQAQALALFIEAGQRGLTREELERKTGWKNQTVNPRVWELKKKGLIESAGKRKTTSGRPAEVLRAISGASLQGVKQ